MSNSLYLRTYYENLNEKEQQFLRTYLFNYLDGDFSKEPILDRKFIRLCKKAFNNQPIKEVYRATRDVYNLPRKDLTSSHPKFISTSLKLNLAMLASYGYGIDLSEDYDCITVYAIRDQAPLLTYKQILSLVLTYSPTKHEIIERTIQEQECIFVYTKELFKNSEIVAIESNMTFLERCQKVLTNALDDISINMHANAR